MPRMQVRTECQGGDPEPKSSAWDRADTISATRKVGGSAGSGDWLAFPLSEDRERLPFSELISKPQQTHVERVSGRGRKNWWPVYLSILGSAMAMPLSPRMLRNRWRSSAGL